MKKLSFRDAEQLSASLDGQLPRADAARLEARLSAEPDLAALLEDLRTARSLLGKTPRARVPRNFTLTPKMAGLRPPLPRSVPVLSWASAAAMLLFVCTLGTNLLGRISFGAASAMPVVQSSEGVGYGGGPAATEAPVSMESMALTTPTEAALTRMAVQTTLEPETSADASTRNFEPPSVTEAPAPGTFPWLWLWPGLAGLLLVCSLLIRWISLRSFRRKSGSK